MDLKTEEKTSYNLTIKLSEKHELKNIYASIDYIYEEIDENVPAGTKIFESGALDTKYCSKYEFKLSGLNAKDFVLDSEVKTSTTKF